MNDIEAKLKGALLEATPGTEYHAVLVLLLNAYEDLIDNGNSEESISLHDVRANVLHYIPGIIDYHIVSM